MSTKQTQNYGLHLWEPQDKFLRTEFNENSTKIDTALTTLAKGSWQLLKAQTAVSTMTQWDVNVSDIDFHQYVEVILDYTQEASVNGNFTILFNGKTTGYGAYSVSGGTQSSSLLTFSRGELSPCSVRISFLPHLYGDMIHAKGAYLFGTSSWRGSDFNMISTTTFSELRTINLVGTIPVGSTIEIMAVK